MKYSIRGIEVGLQVYIENEFDNRNIKLKTRIIGWEDNKCIIACLPYLNGIPVNWDNDAPCIIKYINEGEVFAFRTNFILRQFKPVPMVFFTWPGNIENISLRKHKRIQTYIITSIYRQKDKAEIDDSNQINFSEDFDGIIVDLSQGGALITLNNPATRFFVDEQIELDFTLPSGEKIIKLVATIRTVRLEQGKKKIGISFNANQSTQLNKIAIFFSKLEDTL